MAGLLARLFGAARPPEQRRSGVASVGWGLGPISTGGGSTINARVAENLSTVTSCINVVSSTVATLPAFVYRATEGGRVEAPLHPVSRLIQAPNTRQTWPDFMEWLVSSVLLHGNALAVIDYDGAGRPTALTPVPWQNVLVQLLPTGELAFDVQRVAYPWGGTGAPRRFLEGEVVHVKDRSDDGYLGRSRLSRAPEVLAAAMGLQTFSLSVWANAAMPSGVLKYPGALSNEAKQGLSRDFGESFGGAARAGRVPVLEEGMSWEASGMSPEDAEVLASRRFSTEEIARLFGVPPPLCGIWDHSTFTNSATAGAWFGQFCILPLVRKIEAEFLRSVFADPGGEYHLELDMAGLTRGDFGARWAAYDVALRNDVLTRNEVREAEGFPPRADGDAPISVPGEP